MEPEERPARTVKIAELKNRLSYYLRRVQRGEAILVADRDRVIARIERTTAGESRPVVRPRAISAHDASRSSSAAPAAGSAGCNRSPVTVF